MFPRELISLPNWVGYKVIQREGRDVKVPMNPKSGTFAESNNKATWGTHDQAIDSATKYGWAGIGFMFEAPYIGIDLDDCVENGVINDFAREIIRSANTYTEFSPSGTGIHMIGKGILSRSIKKKEIEVYQTGRYFTVTKRLVQPARLLRTLDLGFLNRFYGGEIASTNALAKISTIQDGSRNNDFYSMASSFRARGCEPQQIYDFLEPKAKELNFPLDELKGICSRMVKYPAPVAPKLEGQGESVEDFLADRQDVKWICEPFIAEQSIGFIAGLPESRKSWILIDLAVACASGSGSWLNRYPINSSILPNKPIASGNLTKCQTLNLSPSAPSPAKLNEPRQPHGTSSLITQIPQFHEESTGQTQAIHLHGGHRVLLIDQERSKSETQRRLRSVIAGRGLRVADIRDTLFVRSSTSTRLDNQASYDSLRKELAELRPTLLLVDSFATFHTKNESNRMEIQQVMERIKEIRNEFKCAVILIHHETKSAYAGHREGQPSSYLDMAGNVAIPAAAEFCMNVVKRDEETSWCHHTKNTQGLKEPPFIVKVSDVVPDHSIIKVEAF